MALKTDNKIYLSWDDVEKSVNDLCNKIRFDQPNIDSVHGIARGGLIPAVLLSHKLNLPYTNVILPNTLVVDDICDSGVTMKDYAPQFITATLCMRYVSETIPEYYGEKIEDDRWVVFPWERIDSKTKQDYLDN